MFPSTKYDFTQLWQLWALFPIRFQQRKDLLCRDGLVWRDILLFWKDPFSLLLVLLHSFSLPVSRSLALPFSHSPGRLGNHKVGWCLRIMAAEGRGSGHLANAAPICFYERGEEFSEDTTFTRTTRSAAKRGRLKIKLVNILPVSPCDAHFSVQELIAAAIYITKT